MNISFQNPFINLNNNLDSTQVTTNSTSGYTDSVFTAGGYGLNTSWFGEVTPSYGFLGTFGIAMPTWLHPAAFMQAVSNMPLLNSWMNFGTTTGLGNLNMNLGNTGYISGAMGGIPATPATPATPASNKTSKEKTDKDKCNELTTLLNGFANSLEEEDTELKTQVKEIVDDKKLTDEQKLSKLQDCLDDDGRSALTDYIISNKGSESLSDGLSVDKIIEYVGNDKSIEEINTPSKLTYTSIRSLLDNDESNMSAVRLISAYNNSNRNIVEDLSKKAANDADAQQALAYLRDSLIEEAKIQAQNVAAGQSIDTEKLYGELANIKNLSSKEFVEKFNRCYAQTRVLMSKTADQILSKKFNIELSPCMTKVNTSLRNEHGIKADDINAVKDLELHDYVTTNGSYCILSNSTGSIFYNKTGEQKIKFLCEHFILKPIGTINVKDSEGNTQEVEAYATRQGECQSRYVLVDNEIYKLKWSNGGWAYDGDGVDCKNEFLSTESSVMRAAKNTIQDRTDLATQKIDDFNEKVGENNKLSPAGMYNGQTVYKAQSNSCLYILKGEDLYWLKNAKLENNVVKPNNNIKTHKVNNYANQTANAILRDKLGDDAIIKYCKTKKIAIPKGESTVDVEYRIYAEMNTKYLFAVDIETGDAYIIDGGEVSKYKTDNSIQEINYNTCDEELHSKLVEIDSEDMKRKIKNYKR